MRGTQVTKKMYDVADGLKLTGSQKRGGNVSVYSQALKKELVETLAFPLMKEKNHQRVVSRQYDLIYI